MSSLLCANDYSMCSGNVMQVSYPGNNSATYSIVHNTTILSQGGVAVIDHPSLSLNSLDHSEDKTENELADVSSPNKPSGLYTKFFLQLSPIVHSKADAAAAQSTPQIIVFDERNVPNTSQGKNYIASILDSPRDVDKSKILGRKSVCFSRKTMC